MKVRKRINPYSEKRRRNGGDFYGQWKEGVQRTAERINGRTLIYDAKKGQWR